MCEYCELPYGECIKISNKSKLFEEIKCTEAQIIQNESDKPGIILYRNGLFQGDFDINYCPMCGKKL